MFDREHTGGYLRARDACTDGYEQYKQYRVVVTRISRYTYINFDGRIVIALIIWTIVKKK